MDLLKTILLYLTMVFVSSVQMAPEPSLIPETPTPSPALIASATPTLAPTPTPTPVPTPNITPNTAYRTMKVGDKGDNVLLLQRRLAELGYYTGDVDGVFGNQTRRAVERFQYYQGLSADGIAGKRTQTVLFESPDVVFAPVDVSPSPPATGKATVSPTAAATSAPPASTPAPTFIPKPSATVAASTAPTSSEVAASLTPAASETASPTSEPVTPVLLTEQTFVLAGQMEPLTLTPQATVLPEQATVLHPLHVGDVVYVPFVELLRSAGTVLIPGNDTASVQVAFSLVNDLYQLSYGLDDAGAVTNLTVLKNLTPQLLSLRNGILLDGLLYLPMQVTTELTGIAYTPDDPLTRYAVTMPAPPEN